MASGLFHEGSDVVLKSTGLFREDLKLLIEEYLEGREVSKEFEWYPCRTLALYVKQVVAAFDEGCMHAMRLEPDVEYGPLVVPLIGEEFKSGDYVYATRNGFCFASESSSGNWNEGWFAGQYANLGSEFRYAILISEERAAHINKYFGLAKKDGIPFSPELAAKIVYGEMDQ
jgi:hypothetical protein